MNNKNPKVDACMSRAGKWREEFEQLRMIMLDCPLTEELKWGWPCYTYQQSNIVLMHGFKEYCALLFMKGVLLKDPKGILIQQTEKVQSARQIRFTTVREIVALKSVLRAYLLEAIAVEKAGLKVNYKKEMDPIPVELQSKMDQLPALKAAFAALSPGRQRGYIYYIAAPKQSKTRASRVDKSMPLILKGKGLND